jgi:hypothetical protein
MRHWADSRIKKEISKALRIFESVGLRHDSRNLAEQEYVGNSYRWDDDIDTGEQLDGTSAIDASRPDALKLIKYYRSLGNLYLIASDTGSYRGEDPGEIVIPDAIVARRLF